MNDSGHVPVLRDEVLSLFDVQPGETAVDCTVGRGGHAERLAHAVGEGGTIVGIDLDPQNVEFARRRLESCPARRVLIQGNFAGTARLLAERALRADVVLADLGFSSSQMDDAARGFSFSADGPLDMRLDPEGALTAAELVNTMSERDLADLIYRTGEDPFARKIARKLVEKRAESPIRTTARLAAVVQEAYGRRARESRMHPATRTFMALRIAVNDELGALRSLADSITNAAERIGSGASTWLASGARVGVISFHSLEDRIVKQCFADIERRGLGTRLTRKPVIASDEEARLNPRARSAKCRVARIGDPSNVVR